MKMVERVARALHKAGKPAFAIEDFESLWPEMQENYRIAARAAIEAMREPTDAMRDAMADEYMKGEIDVWLGGIDAAISEATQKEEER